MDEIEQQSIATDESTAGQESEAKNEGAELEKVESDDKPETKPEKTAEQREIDRLRRGIDRRTRQLSDARAELQQQSRNTAVNQEDDSEPQTFTRAQIHEMVTAEAKKLAPTLRDESAEVERRQGVIQSLSEGWGKEKFDELSSDLDEAFSGLMDRSGRPKPAIEAVFESANPAALIEWLADPDNADEAEKLSKMTDRQAGREIALLELKLSSKPKPKVSKAPAPLEPVKGQGAISAAPDPSNTKAWIKWRNEQERKGN